MPPHRPERFNAKARTSIAGGSGHKKRKRGENAQQAAVDSNAAILTAQAPTAQDARKAQLRDEVRKELSSGIAAQWLRAIAPRECRVQDDVQEKEAAGGIHRVCLTSLARDLPALTAS